jgi:hypothetical protein
MASPESTGAGPCRGRAGGRPGARGWSGRPTAARGDVHREHDPPSAGAAVAEHQRHSEPDAGWRPASQLTKNSLPDTTSGKSAKGQHRSDQTLTHTSEQ